jgi:hypothetical protein
MLEDALSAIDHWDEHKMSPTQVIAAQPTTNQSQKHHAHRHMRLQDQSTLRRRLRAPKNLVGCCTTFSVNTDDEDGSADREIKPKTVDAQRQGRGNLNVYIHEWTVPTLSRSHLHLLLGKNGENVEEVCQWYVACQLPDQDCDFRFAKDEWMKDIWDMSRSSEAILSGLGAFAMH